MEADDESGRVRTGDRGRRSVRQALDIIDGMVTNVKKSEIKITLAHEMTKPPQWMFVLLTRHFHGKWLFLCSSGEKRRKYAMKGGDRVRKVDNGQERNEERNESPR